MPNRLVFGIFQFLHCSIFEIEKCRTGSCRREEELLCLLRHSDGGLRPLAVSFLVALLLPAFEFLVQDFQWACFFSVQSDPCDHQKGCIGRVFVALFCMLWMYFTDGSGMRFQVSCGSLSDEALGEDLQVNKHWIRAAVTIGR